MDEERELITPELKPPLHNTAAPRDGEPDVDLQKLLKWQEERIARKLRGEYESATLRLAEVVSRIRVQTLHLTEWHLRSTITSTRPFGLLLYA